ncbi:MAG: branched-chain amino acid ABC transporter permease [Deferribacteraceae bacterium]|jgi:branched-chain amino acid transport system permease protein|nr:branched-chain amino acid ABC transporter permease [Deferribacteraceae bacterium]
MSQIFNSYLLQIITICSINIIIVAGLNLVTGVTGQLSLGHAGFMSVGAYTAAILMMKAGLPFFFALIAAAASAALAGLCLGLPLLRLRGDYLAIATLGFCEIVRVVFLYARSLTRGAVGISGIPYHTSVGLTIIIAALSLIFMYNLENSRFGLALKSIREDELAAEMMGINVIKYKIIAFAIGSAFAGIGGALYACRMTIITPADFGFMKSIEQLCMLVLGGMGSLMGVVVGVVILTAVPELLRFASEYRMVMYGLVMVMIMAYRPQGLFGKIKVNI